MSTMLKTCLTTLMFYAEVPDDLTCTVCFAGGLAWLV